MRLALVGLFVCCQVPKPLDYCAAVAELKSIYDTHPDGDNGMFQEVVVTNRADLICDVRGIRIQSSEGHVPPKSAYLLIRLDGAIDGWRFHVEPRAGRDSSGNIFLAPLTGNWFELMLADSGGSSIHQRVPGLRVAISSYDANGLRTERIDPTATTRYLLDGARVLHQHQSSRLHEPQRHGTTRDSPRTHRTTTRPLVEALEKWLETPTGLRP